MTAKEKMEFVQASFENLAPEVKDWLKERKDAARDIDPQTAEVTFEWGEVGDPYGVLLDCSEEIECVGRIYFARAPGSDIWVEFGDLPESVREELWEMHRHKLAFPAGLPDVIPWEDTAE